MKNTQREELFSTVIEKAWEDAAFKQELIADPVAAIEKLTGVKMNIPEGKKIVVRDQSSTSTIYINIPSNNTSEDIELNEEQLELVAGGKAIVPTLWTRPIEILDCFSDPVKSGYAPDVSLG